MHWIGRHQWASLCGLLPRQRQQLRHSSASASAAALPQQMAAWQLHKYGGLEELELSTSMRVPPIVSPQDVLIRVHAASVNPVDAAMLGGYGSSTVNVLRRLTGQLEFPLTLGRDFSGEVAAVGGAVTSLRPGDLVWGVTPPNRPGSHAQYTTTAACHVTAKPASLSHCEAASMPYGALTAWSALVVTGHLWSEAARRGARVLVLGASGGIGTIATQMLKAWGCEVTVTCAGDAVPLLEELGADLAIDYSAHDADDLLVQTRGYDLILDCAGQCTERWLPLLKRWTYAKYVTLSPPLLRNNDADGLPAGTLRSAAQLARANLASHRHGRTFRWAFFMPNPCALHELTHLVNAGRIRPVVQRQVAFSDLPAAYRAVRHGHARGKTVVNVAESGGGGAQRRQAEPGADSDARPTRAQTYKEEVVTVA